MDRSGLLAFNTSAEAHRVALLGVRAIFRDVEIEVLESSSSPSLRLAVGGFREDGVWRIRIPATVQPAPAAKEPITQLGTGLRYIITSVVPAPADSAVILYHTVEAQLP